MKTKAPTLDLIYKEVKSLSHRLNFLEDLAEEVILSQLPKGRLTKAQEAEVKRRLAEMKSGERTTLEELKRA